MAYPTANGQATVTSGSSSHLPSEYWTRKALSQLKKIFLFRKPCMAASLPKGSGNTMKWYRYALPSAMTTARTLGVPGTGTEGQIGTGTTNSDVAISAAISQYTNYMAVSDAAEDLSFAGELNAAAESLGYQAGLSTDVITRTEIDSASASFTISGSFLRAADLSAMKTVLEALDVQPLEDGFFMAVVHPYAAYDFRNDATAGGYFDLNKYSNPEELKKSGNLVGIYDGVKVYKSTNVKVDTTQTPDTYNTYLFGFEGLAAVDLEGKGPSKVVDPSKERFKINVVKGGPDKTDPEGVIAGIASYNFWYACKNLAGAGGVNRFRVATHNVSLVTT